MSVSWKEIVWAGDGFQVFVQLLFHLYRLRDADVLVLDEPDAYLHADLQRRLIQAAQTLPAQLIVATHSTEIVTEVGAAALTLLQVKDCTFNAGPAVGVVVVQRKVHHHPQRAF